MQASATVGSSIPPMVLTFPGRVTRESEFGGAENSVGFGTSSAGRFTGRWRGAHSNLAPSGSTVTHSRDSSGEAGLSGQPPAAHRAAGASAAATAALAVDVAGALTATSAAAAAPAPTLSAASSGEAATAAGATAAAVRTAAAAAGG